MTLLLNITFIKYYYIMPIFIWILIKHFLVHYILLNYYDII